MVSDHTTRTGFDSGSQILRELETETATTTRSPPPRNTWILVAQAQIFDQASVRLKITVLEIRQEPTTATDHLQQSTTAVMIVLVCVEVAPKVVDALRKESNLNRGTTHIAIADAVLFNNCGLVDAH